MDGRGSGECCTARYAGGYGGYHDNSKIDRIMLRFRPIAPKPVSPTGSISGASSPEKNQAFLRCSRVKRKYVRSGNKKLGRKRKVSSEAEIEKVDSIVTLSLIPEKPDEKEDHAGGISTPTPGSPTSPTDSDKDPFELIWLNSVGGKRQRSLSPSDQTVVVAPQPVRPVGSCVTVEGVTTEGCTYDGKLLGSTDVERMKNLEKDTCPGFISDAWNKVKWTNEAYRKMVNDHHQEEGGEARPEIVWLVVKERLPSGSYEGFACRVRLQYTRRKERNRLTVPCDVWRMEGGGFAWRLDVKAALCLGR